MDDKRVLLINPPLKGLPAYEPLGLLYLAASLRQAGYTVELLDYTLHLMPMEQAAQQVMEKAGGLIGITMPFQPSARGVMEFIVAVRDAGYEGFIAVGGIFPTFAYEDILNTCPDIDAIVRGDGEETILELAGKVLSAAPWKDTLGLAWRDDGEVKTTAIRPSVKKLDTLPFPARDTLDEVYAKEKTASMYTSRGCYGKCTFCSIVPFFKMQGTAIRFRSARNVVDEIEQLVNNHGVQNIMFDDSNFTNSAKRCEEIANEILARDIRIHFSIECRADDVKRELFTLMAKAGLKRVFLGVESGSDSQLARYRKETTAQQNLKALELLNELKIYTTAGFIMFDAGTTPQEVKENKAMSRAIKRLSRDGYIADQYVYNTVMLPLSGTEYERMLKEQGKYLGGTFQPHARIENGRTRLACRLMRSVFLYTGMFIPAYLRHAKWSNLWKL